MLDMKNYKMLDLAFKMERGGVPRIYTMSMARRKIPRNFTAPSARSISKIKRLVHMVHAPAELNLLFEKRHTNA